MRRGWRGGALLHDLHAAARVQFAAAVDAHTNSLPVYGSREPAHIPPLFYNAAAVRMAFGGALTNHKSMRSLSYSRHYCAASSMPALTLGSFSLHCAPASNRVRVAMCVASDARVLSRCALEIRVVRWRCAKAPSLGVGRT